MIKIGKKQADIAKQFKISQRTLERWWSLYKKESNKDVAHSFDDIREDVITLLSKGKSPVIVAKQFGIKMKVVKTFENNFKPEDNVKIGNFEKTEQNSGEVVNKCDEIVNPDEMPLDKNFLEAQGKLKSDLLDLNQKDPRVSWQKYHNIKISRNLQINFICPLCNIIFTTGRVYDRWKYFLQHLRNHKYEQNSCGCTQSYHGDDSLKRKHIQEVHWGWTKCSLCTDSKFMDAATLK